VAAAVAATVTTLETVFGGEDDTAKLIEVEFNGAGVARDFPTDMR